MHIYHLTEATNERAVPEGVANCEDNHHLRQERLVLLNQAAAAVPGSDYLLITQRCFKILTVLLTEIQVLDASLTNQSNVHPDPKQSDDNQAQQKKSSSLEAFEGKAQLKKWFVVETLDAKARNPMMFAKGLF